MTYVRFFRHASLGLYQFQLFKCRIIDAFDSYGQAYQTKTFIYYSNGGKWPKFTLEKTLLTA